MQATCGKKFDDIVGIKNIGGGIRYNILGLGWRNSIAGMSFVLCASKQGLILGISENCDEWFMSAKPGITRSNLEFHGVCPSQNFVFEECEQLHEPQHLIKIQKKVEIYGLEKRNSRFCVFL